MAGRAAASIGKDKVGRIGADGKDHVAGVETNFGIGMGGEVVEKHVAGSSGVFGRSSLIVRNFVESGDDRGVTTARVVKKQTRNLLDTLDTKFIEERRQIGVGKLDFLAVDGSGPEMGGMLRAAGCRMTQSQQGFGDIAGHGEVDVTGVIIPVDLKTEVTGTGPVFGQSVSGGKSSKEVVRVSFGEEFDAEIVDSKGEGGSAIGMAPEARGLTDREVAEGSKMSFELIVGQDGSLFEAIHPFADFDVNVAFGIEMGVSQGILVDDFGGNVFAMDTHVLVNYHVGDEKEVFQVTSAVSSAEVGVGDDTVEVKFGVDEPDGWGANVLIGVEAIAADSHADTVWFGFAGSHGADEVCIRNLATSRDLMR